MNQSESISDIVPALIKAQFELKSAAKDSTNPHLRSKYADLASVWDACRESLVNNGLAVLQPHKTADGGVCVETVIIHESGQWVSGETFIPVSGGSNVAQSYGSAITYARRYGLGSMLGVLAEDDDGHSAGHRNQHEDTQPAEQREYRSPQSDQEKPLWKKCLELSQNGPHGQYAREMWEETRPGMPMPMFKVMSDEALGEMFGWLTNGPALNGELPFDTPKEGQSVKVGN